MGPHKPIRLTAHVAMRARERGIALDWIHETLMAPDLAEIDPAGDGRMRAFRRMSALDGRVLRVVYVEEQDQIRIITVTLDRNRGRRMP